MADIFASRNLNKHWFVNKDVNKLSPAEKLEVNVLVQSEKIPWKKKTKKDTV